MPTNKKRVYCLYRVSTLGQVEKDDIPMQRQACREFSDSQGWEIVKEFSEKGISGFKVSAKDRDAIQEIQHDAAENKFDVLLVFMFDRIGRREDETPFVVEWFVREGIEVWSAREGQQRFDSHVDKLTNYIRYWQASGESIKTSIRTKTRLGQIVQEGRFRGGTAPLGYRLEKQGRLNKKNHELYEILIDARESAIVKKIFDLYVNHGYGSHRISTYLHEHDMPNRSGNNFTNTTIQHMLKNKAYLGILKSGETESDIFPDLQIIDPELFEAAQNIIMQRSSNYNERKVPLNTRGNSLLSGNVFCGHCDSRLTITTNGKKYFRKDGEITVTPRTRYVCYNKTRHPNMCDGQTGYTVSKLDGMVEEIVHQFFDRLKDFPKDQIVSDQYESRMKLYANNLKFAKTEHKSFLTEMKEYESEVLKVIRGESKLDSELINKLYGEAKEKVQKSEEVIAKIEAEIQNGKKLIDSFNNQYDNLISWSALYDNSDIEVKKMIISQIFSSVKVRRDYEVDIDLNITFEQLGFGTQMPDESEDLLKDEVAEDAVDEIAVMTMA